MFKGERLVQRAMFYIIYDTGWHIDIGLEIKDLLSLCLT